MLQGFKQFIVRGNVVDLAVGVVIGAAFTSVVNALVSDLLTPLISAVAKLPNFSGLRFSVNGSQFLYGHFINAAISFVLVAAAVYFFVIVPMNGLLARMKRGEVADPTNKQCAECLNEIPFAAKRCGHCGQEVKVSHMA
jgi:large conductance mechanosensitive channel